MTTTADLADFALEVSYDGIPDDTREEIKKRVLDSLGIAVGAMDEDATDAVRATVEDTGETGACTLWGGGSSSPPQAAMYNTSLTRYLDYMDSFLAPGETPHPSDNIASVIACGEHVDAEGEDIIEAVGAAYEVQRALAYNVPVRDRGFDHVTHTVISAAAGAGKILGLDREQLRNAIGIAGTAHNALRVTRTEGINEWKGIASANAARNAVYSCLLAKNGMEGPVNLFEGKKGWNQLIAGKEFDAELDPACSSLHEVMTKKYVAETYAQSAVEGMIELAEEHDLSGEEVESIRLDTFHGAKLIIGGGEGSRHEVETRAEADHSLPYMLAVSLIDREMTNAQYEPDRINRSDVQELLKKVSVEEDEELTERFEEGEMPAGITVELESGEVLEIQKDAFEGHPTQPASWGMLEDKFRDMAADRYGEDRQDQIIEAVRGMEELGASELASLLD